MASADQKRPEEHGGLSVARSEFAASLGRRLESVHSAIAALQEQPSSTARRDNLVRRLHALAASARILGFAAAAESLARAEQQLRTGTADTVVDDLAAVNGQIATLPNLVLRGTYSMAPPPATTSPPGRQSSPFPALQGPWCVLVCGNSELADSLRSAGSASAGFELVHSTDTSRIRELCSSCGPDVVVLDGTLPSLKDVLQCLKDHPETMDIAVIVAQAGDTNTTTLPELGVHTIVTSNLTALALWRAVNQTRHESYSLPPAREPLGDLDLKELFDRASRELKRGLLESADTDSQSMVVPLGDGAEIKAAIWSAVARIRDVLVSKSEGRIHFGAGPDGGIVVASSGAIGSRGRLLGDAFAYDLTGRRVVVADDDPAITWVISGALRTVGAEVREVHDGRSALNLVHQWWPELVITDVLMPGMDGFALCREIKRDVALRDVPVVLLSWKEDLLFRLRELDADADGYLKKEADTSALVARARELLWPRISLERRLQTGQETRGRLDGITPRTLLDLACKTNRNLRIALRDATSHYDIRIHDHNLRAVTRNRANGTSDRGQSALSSLLGVTAGRFSITSDDQLVEIEFTEPTLDAVLRTPILRARAAQRVLSGASLANVEQLILHPDAFSDELSLLPLSLRPIVDELLRGTTPGHLLASGATSLRALESLLSDAARRGVIRSLTGPAGEDLLTREILVLSATPSQTPTATTDDSPSSSTFSFQLSPTPPPQQATNAILGGTSPALAAPAVLDSPVASNPDQVKVNEAEDGFDWAAEASWDISAAPETDIASKAERSSPFSRPRFSAEWGSEKRTSPGVGTFSSTRKLTPPSTDQSSLVNVEPTTVDSQVSGPVATDPIEVERVVTEEEPRHAPAPSASAAVGLLVTSGQQTPELDYKNEIDAVLAQKSQAPDDEAIFPLFPNATPDKRASARNTPVPPVQADVSPCTTMPSELAPRIEPTTAPDAVTTAATSDETEYPAIDETVPTEASTDTSTSRRTDDTAAPPTEDLTGTNPPPKARPKQWPVYLALAISTGILTFFVAWPIVRAFIPPATPQNSEEPAQTAPSATETPQLVPSQVPQNSEKRDDSSAVKETELPSDVTLQPDKGLVVVRTGGVHSIFVDDEFVGRGPERVVTLAPGVHKVRVSLNGEEHTESITAVAGRAVELSVERLGN